MRKFVNKRHLNKILLTIFILFTQLNTINLLSVELSENKQSSQNLKFPLNKKLIEMLLIVLDTVLLKNYQKLI